MKNYDNQICSLLYSFVAYSLYYEKANLIWMASDDVYHLISAIFLTLSVCGLQEGADQLQKGEIGFQMYARFRMGFIGWPNLPM
jgi:hypothetical protein